MTLNSSLTCDTCRRWEQRKRAAASDPVKYRLLEKLHEEHIKADHKLKARDVVEWKNGVRWTEIRS